MAEEDGANPAHSPAFSAGKSRRAFLCLLILLLAFFCRSAPIFSGLPYIDYIDEGYVLHQAIELLENRGLDTKWYGYPSLPAYLTAAAMLFYSPIYRLEHGHGFRRDLPRPAMLHTAAGTNYDLIAPPELIVAGRSVALCLSLATVALAGALGRVLGGDRCAFFALALSAVCPALVSRATNVIVDTFATFCALCCLYFCARILLVRREGTEASLRTSALLAGAAAGLTFACKYTVALVFLAVVFALVRLPLAPVFSSRRCSRRRRLC